MSNPKPHRRLSLTAATVPSAQPDPEPVSTVAPDDPPLAPITPEAAEVSRVMAYMTTDEAEALDELWVKLRRHPARPSKSDILRAAFNLARTQPEALTDALSQQQSSTLSRQRASKKP